MGCSDDIELSENKIQPLSIHSAIDNIRTTSTRINMNSPVVQLPQPYLQSNNDPNFNFPEVEGDIYVGVGLKKMKAYISPIKKEDLEKKRNAFWGTRTEGNEQTWNFLKELCQMPPGEEENILPMLEAYNLIPYKDCINITYDSLGALYEIPNYCINDPYKYEIIEEEKEKPKEEKVKFHLRKGTKQIKITCSNYSNVEKVKAKVANKVGVGEEKIRLFFYGKELKNNYELWNYNISPDCVVTVMIIS